MSTNFNNGSLVMRAWKFDGDCEILAKFQYYGDAQSFAAMKARADAEKGDCEIWFYIAVCDQDCAAQCYEPSIYAEAK